MVRQRQHGEQDVYGGSPQLRGVHIGLKLRQLPREREEGKLMKVIMVWLLYCGELAQKNGSGHKDLWLNSRVLYTAQSRECHLLATEVT